MSAQQPVLYLLFDQLPVVKLKSLLRNINQIEPGHGSDVVTLRDLVNEKSGIYGWVEFGTHRIKLVGIDAPLPSGELQRSLQPAHLNPSQKQELANHRAHMICYYEGENASGVEKFIALYKTAYSLRTETLRGVVNPLTFMCLTTEMLKMTLKPDFLTEFRQSPVNSLAVWLGYVKFFKPDKTVWFATRGNYFFGVPDFAYLGKSLAEGDMAYKMFANITDYAYQSKSHLAAGHTIQIANDVYLRFGPITEYGEYLGEQTLVMQKIKASEINQGK